MKDYGSGLHAPPTFDPSKSRPNVLVICTDHWPGALLRPAGHPAVMTPTLEMLARNGTHFTHAYSACPVCAPARRTIMTGMSARSHGLLTNADRQWDPNTPSLPQHFRNAGYQAYAVGKLHVLPARAKIGFDDVILNEEGRPVQTDRGQRGDDWDQYLTDHGFSGQSFVTGMASNDYLVRPWSLPEHCHPTNWSVQQMCRTISRRDPTRPGFWYLSFITPHPPLQPLQPYLDLYRDVPVAEPALGSWAVDRSRLPYSVQWQNLWYSITNATKAERDLAIRGFYATCTHIDHQIRLVIGTLREQGILHNTVIVFTSDHGDMLGTHGMWAKTLFYEMSANIPFIVVPASGDNRLAKGKDQRLVELRDLMPTVMDLAGLKVPEGLDGYSLLNPRARKHLVGEYHRNDQATRMVRDPKFKLIWYAAGNVRQLFDMQGDPLETKDLSSDPTYAADLDRLTHILVDHIAGGEEKDWVRDNKLVGVPMPELRRDTRDLGNQRGLRYV